MASTLELDVDIVEDAVDERLQSENNADSQHLACEPSYNCTDVNTEKTQKAEKTESQRYVEWITKYGSAEGFDAAQLKSTEINPEQDGNDGLNLHSPFSDRKPAGAEGAKEVVLISTKELNMFKHDFGIIDDDKDGFLTLEEVGQMLTLQLGRTPTSEEVRHFLTKFDSNNDKCVSFDEYINALLGKYEVKADGTQEEGPFRTDDNSSTPLDHEVGDQAKAWVPIEFGKIAAGAGHSMYIAQSGTLHGGGDVFVFGRGSNGQMGLGTLSSRAQPLQATLSGSHYSREMAAFVSAGDEYCAAASISGALFMWGRNDTCQCGTGTHGMVLSHPTPYEVPGSWRQDIPHHPQQVVQVATGRDHTVALTDMGRLFA